MRVGAVDKRGMSVRRLILVNAVLAFLIAAHLYENVIQAGHWPFCSYPMYAELETERSITIVRVFGVRHDGSETAVHRNEFIHPFDQARLADGMENAHFDRSSGVVALNDVLERYERRRIEREHHGPALVRLRLYRLTHQLEPLAGNADTPEKRELLAESDPLTKSDRFE